MALFSKQWLIFLQQLKILFKKPLTHFRSFFLLLKEEIFIY